jgi:hypothetical protein
MVGRGRPVNVKREHVDVQRTAVEGVLFEQLIEGRVAHVGAFVVGE